MTVLRVLVVGTIVLALGVAGCGGNTGAGRGHLPKPSRVGGSPLGPGISVDDALHTRVEGPLLVNGYLIVPPDGPVRLCTRLFGASPPRCGGPSLIVRGLDLAAFPGLGSAPDATGGPGTRWSNTPVQLLGTIDRGVLKIEANARA